MKNKKNIFWILLVALVLTLPGPADFDILAGKQIPKALIVVDAGHGGPDGGAEGSEGTMEKDINLSIAKEVQQVAKAKGIEVILTRNTAEGLYREENVEKRWRKIEDMGCRKKIVKDAKPDAVISIHLNSFWSDTKVRGAQVFYPKSGRADVTEKSRTMAERIQKSLINTLKDGSNRIQMGKEDFYLFKEAEQPVVLVECGFLSNPQDLANLKQKTYQRRIAEAIVDGMMDGMEI